MATGWPDGADEQGEHETRRHYDAAFHGALGVDRPPLLRYDVRSNRCGLPSLLEVGEGSRFQGFFLTPPELIVPSMGAAPIEARKDGLWLSEKPLKRGATEYPHYGTPKSRLGIS